VFASSKIFKGEFVLDYVGELLKPEVADELPDQTYVYYFDIGSKHWR